MPLRCHKTAFLGGYWGYLAMPVIRLKIAQNSPILGGICRVMARWLKSCLKSPKNALKNGRFLPFFGGRGIMPNSRYEGNSMPKNQNLIDFFITLNIKTRNH